MENDVFLSADQTRQLLHISKRKCAWMLQNGIIPCTVNGKKTHCYRVRLENLTIRGGRHSVFAETLNKESANFRITNCRFLDSSEIAFLSHSYKTDKGAIGAWTYDEKTGVYASNPKYWTEPKRHNNHSSMVVIDNCRFENCDWNWSMYNSGTWRNCTAKNCRFCCAIIKNHRCMHSMQQMPQTSGRSGMHSTICRRSLPLL